MRYFIAILATIALTLPATLVAGKATFSLGDIPDEIKPSESYTINFETSNAPKYYMIGLYADSKFSKLLTYVCESQNGRNKKLKCPLKTPESTNNAWADVSGGTAYLRLGTTDEHLELISSPAASVKEIKVSGFKHIEETVAAKAAATDSSFKPLGTAKSTGGSSGKDPTNAKST
ncbi:hypothetical protein T439DRAFT_329084 [Meredithblackwellia eburnea MCA 4105]